MLIRQLRKMRDQKGAALIEYILIAALIAVVVVVFFARSAQLPKRS